MVVIVVVMDSVFRCLRQMKIIQKIYILPGKMIVILATTGEYGLIFTCIYFFLCFVT